METFISLLFLQRFAVHFSFISGSYEEENAFIELGDRAQTR